MGVDVFFRLKEGVITPQPLYSDEPLVYTHVSLAQVRRVQASKEACDERLGKQIS